MQNNLTTINVAFLGMFMAFCTVSANAAPPANPAPLYKGNSHQAAISEDNAKWRRDPFSGADAKNSKIPAGGTPAGIIRQQPELNVQGIMQAGKAFHALINGRIVKTGDKLEGQTIREISRYRIVVHNDKKEKTIYDIYKGKIHPGEK